MTNKLLAELEMANRTIEHLKNNNKTLVAQKEEAYRIANKEYEENQSLKEKYNQALSILAEYSPPCELDGFMDKNTDYCSINCGVDEDVFKECWNRYIEQKVKGDKE